MMNPTQIPGSAWRRWDVHVHAPGTLFSDNFGDNWNGYLAAIEAAPASVCALGITDYFVLDSYKRVREARHAGRLKNIEIVFPNLEFRVGAMTTDKKALNLHLLVCPDDPDHIDQLEHCLSLLTFESNGKQYACTNKSLIELGRAFKNSPTLPEASALREGAGQFKVEFSAFREWYGKHAWLRENTLVACSNNRHDGTSGIRDYEPAGQGDAWVMVRDEVLRFCHIVFSANPSDRDYYLGLKPGVDLAELRRRIGGQRPCLHGSDAHDLARVLNPNQKRYCWIRAEPSFAGLRQVIAEPDARVHIGEVPPETPPEAQSIEQITVTEAPWLATASIPLNPGLNTIIGPRGSGKTALADMLGIAAGARASGTASFVKKAGDLLDDATVELGFRDGSSGDSFRLQDDGSVLERHPYVRYLSQQFVDDICSSVGTQDDRLLAEVEKVVYGAVPEEERAGTTSFDELRTLTLSEVVQRRAQMVARIGLASAEIERISIKKGRSPSVKGEIAQLKTKIAGAEEKRKQLMAPFDPVKKAALEELVAALEVRTKAVSALLRQHTKGREAVSLVQKVAERLKTDATELHALLREAGVPEESLPAMTLQLDPKVASQIQDLVKNLKTQHDTTKEKPIAVAGKVLTPSETEQRRKALAAELGLHTQKQAELTALDKQLGTDRTRLSQLEVEAKDTPEALETLEKTARNERRDAYGALLETFQEEAKALVGLYQPLATWLSARNQSEERDLSVVVERVIDMDDWAARGEELFDLRKLRRVGDYDGIAQAADTLVRPAWMSGDVSAAYDGLAKLFLLLKPSMDNARAAGVSIASIAEWLFSLDHVRVRYRLTFGGTDISKLSPGMRGIVLLILFLAVDRDDSRPLIIDQPEENLDPKSVYQILVPYFRDIRKRRQVVVVTHNANLVVNTDADNVIVAKSQRTDPAALPSIQYVWGGLENKDIRDAVCDILEGGADAFEARERRYRLAGVS